MTHLPRIAAFTVVAIVGALAFVLSFTALADLAAHHAVPRHQAWMIPVVVDASIIGATLAVISIEERRWFAWSLLAIAASLSVAGNIAHAWEYGPVAIVIAAVPPLFLLAMTELAVIVGRAQPARAATRPVVLPLLPPGVTTTDPDQFARSWREKHAHRLEGAALQPVA